MSWPWPDYVHQRFPNLSDSRLASNSIHHTPTTPIPNVDRDTLRAAFITLVLAYHDVPELVFAQINDSDSQFYFKASKPSSSESWSEWITNLPRSTDVSLEKAREVLGSSPVSINFSNSIPTDASGTIILESSGGVRLSYDNSLLSDASAQVLLDQVIILYQHILSSPDSPASLNSPDTTIFPTHLASASQAEYDTHEAHLTVDWLARNARDRPDSIAHEIYTSLSKEPTLTTYKQLNESANQMARFLIDKGLEREDRVCVCRTRDLYFYIAHAAIFKAGGCYVSIDPELPEERKRHIASDSGAKFVISSPELSRAFETALTSEDIQQEVATYDSSDISLAELDSLAYLLYTSGTTGKPKGCLLMHRGLYWAIDAMCQYPRKVTDPTKDKRLAMASIAFDVHISEITQVWCLGIRLVSAPRFELLADLRNHVAKIGITHLGMVPSMIQATLSKPDGLPLKYMVSGGEKISDSLLETWAAHPNLILANFYGPTEATIGCTSRQITVHDKKENIGKPFKCCGAYIVDPETLAILPKGVAGELIIEGPLVAKGYHNMPDATKKSFMEWPNKGCRAYRTGDLVRMTPEETLEILGRIDTQIKLRGVRIESEGVSEVIRKASPSVKLHVHTLIATHPQQGNAEVLVSFFAPDDPSIDVNTKRTTLPEITFDSQAISMQALRDAVNRELAVYMRPAHIVPVTFLPLTLNGKTDGKKLLQIFRDARMADLGKLQRSRSQDTTTTTSTTTKMTDEEHRVANVLAGLLDVKPDGFTAATNLFEAGLDSLGFSALARELGISSVGDVVARQTIAEIATLMVRASPDKEAQDVEGWVAKFAEEHSGDVDAYFSVEDVQEVLPLLPIQQGILSQSVLRHHLYVQHFVYRCRGHVDISRLHAAWRRVMVHHDILRAAFIIDPTGLMIVLKPETTQLPWVERDLPQDRDFLEWFSEQEGSRISEDINSDITSPLFRLHVYKSQAPSSLAYFSISIHHALYDGYAFPVLMRRVEAAYHDQSLPPATPLSPIIRDASHPIGASIEFWKQLFDGVEWSSRQVRVLEQESPVSRETKTVADIGFWQVREACQKMRVTTEALFVTVFAAACQKVLGWEGDAIFSLLRSGRSSGKLDLSNAVCPLVAVVPFRVRLNSRTAQDAVRDSQSEITSIIPYEHTPLGTVQRALGVSRLVDAMFSCRQAVESIKYDAWEHQPLAPPQPEFPFVVEVVFSQSTDDIDVTVVAAGDHFSGRAQGFYVAFEQVLRDVVSDTETYLFSHSSTGKPQQPLQQDTPAVSKTFNEQAFNTIKAELCDLLGVRAEDANADSSLISLGLDSLKAIALSRRLESKDLHVSPVDIIQSSTLGDLATVPTSALSSSEPSDVLADLERKLSQELDVPSLSLDSADKPSVTPATALQSGMLSQTMASGGSLYFHAFTFKLRKAGDAGKLKSAWQTAVKSLDILRTSFHFATDEGRWAQVLHSTAPLKWSAEKRDELGSSARDFINSITSSSTSLSQPPLWLRHITVEDDHYLIVVLHHALYDGISLPKLFKFVKDAFRGTPPPDPTQFHSISRLILAAELSSVPYWIRKLEGYKPWPLSSSSDSPSNDAKRAQHNISTSLSWIQRFCRRYQVSSQSLAQTAWAIALASRFKRHDIVFGHVVSGRTFSGAQDAIGPVFNTIPCRINLSSNRSNRDIARAVHAANREALPHHHVSLRDVHKGLGVTSLFETLFLFQPGGEETSTLEESVWEVVSRPDTEEANSQYAINIEVHQAEDGWRLHASCLSSVMDLLSLKSLMEEFDTILSFVVTKPGDTYPLSFTEEVTADSDSQSASSTVDASFADLTTPQKIILSLLSRFTGMEDKEFSPDSQIISLGVDSITAMQISAVAKKQNIPVSPSDIIRSTTVADLLLLVSRSKPELPKPAMIDGVELKGTELKQAISTLPAELRESVVHCTPATPGMMTIAGVYRLSMGTRFQHVFIHRLSKDVDVQRLKDSWESLLEHHEILRTAFVSVDGRVTLNTCQAAAVPKAAIQTIRGDPWATIRKEVKWQHSVLPRVPQPSARFTVLATQIGIFTITSLHHFQYDARTLPMLFEDLQSIYEGSGPHHGGSLTTYLSHYFAEKQANEQAQQTYWTSRSPDGYTPSLLPTLHPRNGPAKRRRLLRKDAVKGLGALRHQSQELSVTLNALILAAFSQCLAKRCRQSSATFGLWQSGQPSHIAVPSLNFLPLLVRDPSDKALKELGSSIDEDLRERSGVIDTSSLSDIARWIGLKEGQPLFNSWINIVRATKGESQNGGSFMKRVVMDENEPIRKPNYEQLPSWLAEIPLPVARDDLWVEVYFNEGERDSLSIFAECDKSILNSKELGEFIQDFAVAIQQLAPLPTSVKIQGKRRPLEGLRRYLRWL